MYCEPDAPPGLYILAVGAFADPNFPALSATRLDAASGGRETFSKCYYCRQLSARSF
jgi:hypothetical protein